MEEMTPESQDTKIEMAKRWLQDNLRIIVSVAIVIVIAGGIYSYSKRSEAPMITEEENGEETSLEEEGLVTTEGGDAATSEGERAAGTETVKTEEMKAPESRETEGSFVEAAAKGEGSTHLARRALANYLEKNTDSSLTKEHKIYIEDYLRKNVGFQGGVNPGTTIEFSKDLIKNAIEKSKTLNEKQLRNLEKYSARVTSLT